MKKTAFVFPGQGAQKVGMGKDAYESHEKARRIFEQADDALGFSLSRLIFEGPEEELKITYHTQPALLTVSIALYEVYREFGATPDYTAGHSLGEYAALVVSGVLSFEDAVRLVHMRGRYMEEAVPRGQGAMAAVLGADKSRLAELCRKLGDENLLAEMANLNSPGQVVVSGSAEGIRAVTERAKDEAGAKRVVPLEVSGPFHSSLMKPAADKLGEQLAAVSLQKPAVPVVANVTARPVRDEETIRDLLVRQVYSPVRWEESVEWLIEDGVDTFVEIGPGKVLSGLIRKINREVNIVSLDTVDSIERVKA